MATGTFSGMLTIGSIHMQANIARTATGTEGHEPAMPAGVPGVLTTRTGDDVGTLTMPTGHGFVTSDILAVFWTAAGVPKVMYGFVATVSGNSVAIAVSGSNLSGEVPDGAVLPEEDSEVVVCKKTTSNVSVAHGDVTMIGVDCDQPAVGIFGSGTSTVIYAAQVPVAYSPVFWDEASGAATPMAADPTKLDCYNGGLVAATFQYGFLLDT